MLKNISQQDPQINSLLQQELERQRVGLEMIASENFVSLAVLEALGTPLTNKYAEGYPGKRYYEGNQYIDQIEQLAIDRARQLFGADHANVQPHSGSQANLAAYLGVLKPGDTILAMDLAAGGHLTHGSPVNFSGRLFNFVHYGVNPDTQLIDFAEIRNLAHQHQPKMIVAGASAYPRQIDFAQFRQIADEVGAYLLIDMAHIAGLVATDLHPAVFPFADIVTTTTHKTLRGPRGAIILCHNDDRLDLDNKKNLAQKIDSAVFPGMQGGPLEHVVAAKAVSFLEALQPQFKQYQQQIINNAKTLEKIFTANEISMVTGGTDNHLLLLDLTTLQISGKQAEQALASAEIYTNKNVVPFDQRKPTDPSGLRLGTAALTTRGLREKEMEQIGLWLVTILKNSNDQDVIAKIKKDVNQLMGQFPLYPELSYE